MSTELLNIEPRKTMLQKFCFKGDYAGQITIRTYLHQKQIQAVSLRINLAAMDTHTNDGFCHATPIADDDDAIARVSYCLNHEWMHYAFEKVEEAAHMPQERMIYAAIGNGGNGMINSTYKIAKNPSITDLYE